MGYVKKCRKKQKMEKVVYKKMVLGVRLSMFPEGSMPHTDPKEPLGLLTLKYPGGHTFRAHIHIPIKRTAPRVQECFIVKKGKVEIAVYAPDKTFVKKIILEEGQAYISMKGGHSLQMLEDCEIWEVKNGPLKNDRIYI